MPQNYEPFPQGFKYFESVKGGASHVYLMHLLDVACSNL
uniref:Uncharacterized protein n=1 Tax=Rhizophora mucronata TaxID=61149 RepID=A0A2P2PX59_RHIMU